MICICQKDQIDIYVPAAYRFENILVEIIQETLGGRFQAFLNIYFEYEPNDE